jgi:hypothetical protein
MQYKINRVQTLNKTYHESLDHSILTEDCDMACATNCVKPKYDLIKMVECLKDQCLCSLRNGTEEVVLGNQTTDQNEDDT